MTKGREIAQGYLSGVLCRCNSRQGQGGIDMGDTTQEYIEQCEKAEEIQALYNLVSIPFRRLRPSGQIVWKGDGSYNNPKYWVWIPRQDDLQKMVLEKRQSSWQLSQSFWNWLWTKEEIVSDKSMEQLWLAFVMHEKYQKQWNTDKEEWELVAE